MNDFMFKYGLIVVGVVIVGLLISFAYKATNKTSIPKGFEQSLKGNTETLKSPLINLCNSCISLSKSSHKTECYLLHLENKGDSITEDYLNNNYNKVFINIKGTASKQILKGNHTIKILSTNNNCTLKMI